MHIVVHDSMAAFDAAQWNALLHDNNPFMRHEFLHGLEVSSCVSASNGWQPKHIAVYSSKTVETLIGAMPCYVKDHSYGEYIFDWSWADAHHRHGLDYYPKLSNAVPFTPATGPRWLSSPENAAVIEQAMLTKAQALVSELNLSSFHCLFPTEEQAKTAEKNGLSLRASSQFHWHNRNFANFDDFLGALTSKKRKNIKRERRRVSEQQVEYRWLTGKDLDATAVAQMNQFYLRTIQLYSAQAYLNRAFFEYLATDFSAQTLFLFAYYNDQAIAGGLYFRGDNALYGRYWGALNNFHSVHFETCYYQPIEWCIQNGIERFEAGAQGQHKLARGLEPAPTHSAHWIAHPEFRNAIDDFLIQEAAHIGDYQDSLQNHSPFRKEL